MVTVEVKNSEEVKELEFPKLMIGSSGVVIWFRSHGDGTVVIGTECGYIAGDYVMGFIMSHFTDFNEEITLTLKNKQ